MHFVWPTAALVILLQCTLFDCALIGEKWDLDKECPVNCSCKLRSVTCETDALSGGGLIRFIDSILSLLKDNIRNLRIIYTDLKEVPMILCSLNRLESLDLSYNRMNKLPRYCLTQIENLMSFKADNNNISTLQAGIFDGLLNLQSISLAQNRISYIDPLVFSNSSDLTSLSFVNLDSNELTTLDPWPLIRAQAFPGCRVVLNRNHIQYFQNPLNWTFKCGSPSISLYLDLGFNKIQRLSDMANGWEFHRFVDALCAIQSRWWATWLLSLYDNRFICDCREFKYFRFVTWVKETNYLDSTYCAEPVSLVNMRTTSVPLDRLLCGINESCPHVCTCSKQPATLTINIDCSNAGVSELPSNIPAIKSSSFYRYNLTFSGSNIGRIQFREYLNHARYFRARRAQVQDIDERTWKSFTGMDEVDLRWNRLEELPRWLKSLDFTNTILNIEGNPIDCSCNNQWLKSWLISLGRNLMNSEGIVCHSPNWLKWKSVLTLNEGDFCSGPPYQLKEILRVVIPSFLASLLLVTVLTVLLLRRCRVKIHAVFKLHPFDRDECEGEDMIYDVFISSCDVDRGRAEEILNQLELNRCETCYHLRDFLPGAPIMDNIETSIVQSKRVLCILSRNFLRSGYCIAEFSMAYDRDISKNRRRLVVLVIEDMSAIADQEIPSDIRNYLERYTYIEYGSGNWLDQLMYAMPINRMGISGHGKEDDVVAIILDEVD